METSLKKKYVIIIDDHSIVRIGIKLLLNELDRDVIIYESGTKEEAFEIFKKVNHFDVIVLDINVPNYSCERMIEFCKIKFPLAKIMVMSMNSESMMAKRFYQLGIDAYVNKGTSDEEIKFVFKELFENRKYYSQDFLKRIAEESFGNAVDDSNPFSNLSQREFEVMKFLMEGKNTQEIASILSIHSSTIGTYKSRIFEKLKVDNLIDLYQRYNQYK